MAVMRIALNFISGSFQRGAQPYRRHVMRVPSRPEYAQ